MRARTAGVIPLAIAVLAIAVYANALGNGLVHDDVPQVLENRWIRDLGNIPDMFRTHVAGFADDQVANYYRPLMHVVYALTYRTFGLRPWAFHLVNILFHAACAVLVWGIARRFLAGAADDRGVEIAAAVAGALFAVHPIHTEAVTWVAGIPDLTYTCLVLAALLAFSRFESGERLRWVSYVAAVALFVPAPFAKEPALALPIVLVALELARGGTPFTVRRWLPIAPFFAVAALYVAARFHALGDLAPLPRHAELSTLDCVRNVPVLFAHDLVALALPTGLTAFHVLDPVHALVEPRAFLSVLCCAAFGAAIGIAYRRDRATFLGLLLIAIPLLPVLWIPWVGENSFAERYLYLPSAGFAIVVARIVAWVRAERPAAFRTVVVVTALWLVALGLVTVRRNPVWFDERSLWTDTVAKSPDGALPRTMLGDVYLESGELAQAIEQYEAAIALDPDDPAAPNNLGLAYLYAGRVADALVQLRTADRLEPDSPQTLNNLGLAYKASGRLEQAEVSFLRALDLRPGHPGLLGNLAQVYALQGKDDDARRTAAAAEEAAREASRSPFDR